MMTLECVCLRGDTHEPIYVRQVGPRIRGAGGIPLAFGVGVAWVPPAPKHRSIPLFAAPIMCLSRDVAVQWDKRRYSATLLLSRL